MTQPSAAEWTARICEAINGIVMILVGLWQKRPIKPFLPPGGQKIVRLAPKFTGFFPAEGFSMQDGGDASRIDICNSRLTSTRPRA